MLIHCKFEPERACECVHSCVVVHYTADEVRGMFVDFFEHAEPKVYQIKSYQWDESTKKVHAIVQRCGGGEISEWAMDVTTRVPYLIARFPGVKTKKRRPRKWGSAMWRATQAWENR